MAHIRSLASTAWLLSQANSVSRPAAFGGVRSISQSAVVNAKRKGKATSSGDEFDDDFNGGASGDLFGSNMKAERLPKGSSKSSGKKTSSTLKTSGSTSTEEQTSNRLSSEERLARFNNLYQLLSERIGKTPIKTATQVRKSAWTHLFGLARSQQQMEKLVKLFPQWRDSGREWSPQLVENFTRRCEELACPQLALQVFTDHPKYGMDLATLPAARRLLHSLHVQHPLSDSITLSALYKVYNLPALSSDLVSCAMLTSACFKNNSPEAVTVAKGLVPYLRKLLESTPPEQMALPASDKKALRARTEEKEKAWLAWTLAKIEKALQKQGEEFSWLREWRTASGHVQAAAA